MYHVRDQNAFTDWHMETLRIDKKYFINHVYELLLRVVSLVQS